MGDVQHDRRVRDVSTCRSEGRRAYGVIIRLARAFVQSCAAQIEDHGPQCAGSPLSRDEPMGTEASVLGSLESNDDVRATIEGSRFAARLDLDLEKALVPCIVTRGEEVGG